jgi:hypothetical protein
MANIKFSQFTVGNVQSDIDFVVGYKGGDNIHRLFTTYWWYYDWN